MIRITTLILIAALAISACGRKGDPVNPLLTEEQG